MSAASNGAGSHFAPTPDNGNDTYRSSHDLPVGRHAGSASTGGQQGFSFEAPNGSQATIDPTMPVPGARKVSPSETDTFLAAAVRSAQESSVSRTGSPRFTVREEVQTTSYAASAPVPPTSAPIPRVGPATGAPKAHPGETATIPATWNADDSGVAAIPTSSLGGRPVNPLVAARAAASGQQPKGSSSTTAHAPSQGTAGASGKLFPIQEVEDTGRGGTFDTTFVEGGHKRTALFVVLAIVIVALIFAGIFFGLRIKETADARGKIDDAIGRLRDSDGVIVPLDAAIAAEISSGVASSQLSNLMLQSASTSTALSDAEQFANDAARSSSLLSTEENDAIAAVKSSVAARRSMLEIGRMLLSTDTSVNDALNALAMAYGSIADSNAKIQSSTDQFAAYNAAVENGEDTSGYDLWAIVQIDNDALADLTVAQDWVNSARDAFNGADLTVLDNYLAARINQVNMLIQVDTCIANGDTEGAANLSGPYAEADANAQNAAAQVPATAAELLVGSYANATASQRDAYDAARAKCVEADAVLNTYLGITDVRKEMGVTGDSTVSTATATPTAQITDPVAPVEPAPEEGVPAEGGEAPVEGGEPVEGEPPVEGEAVPEAA